MYLNSNKLPLSIVFIIRLPSSVASPESPHQLYHIVAYAETPPSVIEHHTSPQPQHLAQSPVFVHLIYPFSPSSSFTWTLPSQVIHPTTPSTQPPPIPRYSPACLPTTATATLALVLAPPDQLRPLGKRSTYQHHSHHSQSVSPSTCDRLAGMH